MKKNLWEYRIKNRYLPLLFLFCYCIGTFISIPFHSSVSASVLIELTDWDDVASGLDDGVSNEINFNNIGLANYFETSTDGDLSTPNSFKVVPYNGAGGVKGYWNITTTYSIVDCINFSFITKGTSATESTLNMKFFNGSNAVIYLNILTSTDSGSVIKWYDDAGWETIQTSINNTRYYVVLTHISTNLFNVTLLNSAFVSVYSQNLAGYYAGSFTTFTHIYFEGGAGNNNDAVYFDNLRITAYGSSGGYGSTGELGEVCSGSATTYYYGQTLPTDDTQGGQFIEVEFQQSFTGEIRKVVLPISPEQYNDISSDTASYFVNINGKEDHYADAIVPYNNGYALIFEMDEGEGVDLVNEKPLFAFYSGSHIDYSNTQYWWWGVGYPGSDEIAWSSWHNNVEYYNDAVFNGFMGYDFSVAMCWYYTLNDSLIPVPPIPDADLYNNTDNDGYQETYGNPVFNYSFIEWYHPNYQCFQHVGDHPYIMYFVTDEYYTTNCSFYLFNIKRVGNSNVLYTGMIDLQNAHNGSGFYRIPDTTFPVIGYYYLTLYSTDDYGDTVYEVLDVSSSIYVCPITSGGGGSGGSGGGGGGTNPNEPGYDWDVDFTGYGMYLQFAVFIGLLLTGFFISMKTGGVLVVPSVLFGGMMVCSLPGINIYPTVFMFVCGLALILLFVYTFKRG